LRQFDEVQRLRIAAVGVDPRADHELVEVVECRRADRFVLEVFAVTSAESLATQISANGVLLS